MASSRGSVRTRWVGVDARAGVARPAHRLLVVRPCDRTRCIHGVSRADSVEARRGGSPAAPVPSAHPSRHPRRCRRTRPARPARRVRTVVGRRGMVATGAHRSAPRRGGTLVRHPQSEPSAGARAGGSGRNRCGGGGDHGGGRRSVGGWRLRCGWCSLLAPLRRFRMCGLRSCVYGGVRVRSA